MPDVPKLTYELRGLNNLIMRNIGAKIRQAGVDNASMMHFWIIEWLNEQGDADVFQRDIETRFSITRSTVTNILQVIEKKGYIKRTGVKEDARLKKLTLTQEGKDICAQVREEVEKMDQYLTRGMSEDEISFLLNIIEKIKTNIK